MARASSAQATTSCALALPPRISATRGSIAPALTMAPARTPAVEVEVAQPSWLRLPSEARLPSLQAACSCSSSLPGPRSSATRLLVNSLVVCTRSRWRRSATGPRYFLPVLRRSRSRRSFLPRRSRSRGRSRSVLPRLESRQAPYLRFRVKLRSMTAAVARSHGPCPHPACQSRSALLVYYSGGNRLHSLCVT
eukprot:scaffold41444_cov57-Phaeocystis_antarctica.AAC.4